VCARVPATEVVARQVDDTTTRQLRPVRRACNTSALYVKTVTFAVRFRDISTRNFPFLTARPDAIVTVRWRRVTPDCSASVHAVNRKSGVLFAAVRFAVGFGRQTVCRNRMVLASRRLTGKNLRGQTPRRWSSRNVRRLASGFSSFFVAPRLLTEFRVVTCAAYLTYNLRKTFRLPFRELVLTATGKCIRIAPGGQ